MNMKSINCCICSDESIQQEAEIRKAKLHKYSDDTKITYVKCSRCQRSICHHCVVGALNRITDGSVIPRDVVKEDKTVCILRQFKELIDTNTKKIITIQGPCTCCSMSSEKRPGTQPSRSISGLSILYMDENYTPDDNDDGSEDETDDSGDDLSFRTNKEGILKLKTQLKHTEEDESAVNHLHGYFDDPRESGFIKCVRPNKLLREYHRKRRKNNKKKRRKSAGDGGSEDHKRHNPYEGALIIPLFNLIIAAEAHNDGLVCDHLAHAQSKEVDDMTPNVSHAVLSKESASEIFEYSKEHINLDKFASNTDSVTTNTVVVENVESPESDTRRRGFTIQVIVVNQAVSVADVEEKFKRGDNDFSATDVGHYHLFSNDHIQDDVDAVMIIGNFCLENNSTTLGKKLLLFRFTGMVSNGMNWGKSLDDKLNAAGVLYKLIRSICGKRGFELNRFGGSSGTTDHTADRNLLFTLVEHEGTLPRKAYATFILRDRLGYYFVYRKCNKPGFGVARYSPPKEGGQFKMPHSLLANANYPFLSEMTYLKMLTVLVMSSFNEQHSNQFGKVAAGPVKCEMRKIKDARSNISLDYSTTRNKWLLQLLKNYNDEHHYSLVAHPVGLHNDTFKEGEESLENKLLLCSSPPNNISEGRGGSLVAGKFVYALLDW